MTGVIIAIILLLSSLLVGSLGTPEDQGLRGKARILIKVSERGLFYLELLVENTDVDLTVEIENLRSKIEEAKKLFEEEKWEEVIDMCMEILATIEELQDEVLSRAGEGYAREFEERVEEEIAKGRQNKCRRLIKALEVLAEESNATFVVPLIEGIKEAIEGGELNVYPGIASIARELRRNLRERLAEKLKKRAEEIVGSSVGTIDEEDLEKAGQGILVAIEAISNTTEHLEEVIEHLKTTNASETAILAIKKTIEHLKWVIEHLEFVHEKIVKEMTKLAPHERVSKLRDLIRDLKKELIPEHVAKHIPKVPKGPRP